MNRRQLLLSGASLLAAPAHQPVGAIDIDVAESPIMNVLRMLPDRKGVNGENFAPTSGMNHRIQRNVWPQNPDMYWDPVGDDYHRLLGFRPNAMNLSASYDGTSISTLDNTQFNDLHSIEMLESHGWEVVDEELRLLHYAGSDDDRLELAETLNEMGRPINEGRWDWICFPDVAHLISGADEHLVRSIADRVQNFTAMTTIDSNFHGLRNILQPAAYSLSLLPPHVLPVKHATAAYISKTWHGETPIVHSIGLRLESADQVEPTIEMIRQRMTTEISSSTDTAYADFLEITDVEIYTSSVRIDFIDTSDSWNIVQKVDENDLRMLPPG